MSIKKTYYKKKGICKVTFSVPESQCNGALKAHVVGEFNNWSTNATPMKPSRKGVFTASLDLVPGRRYQFRYLFDDRYWDNDLECDGFADTPYGDARNSVIQI